MECRCEWCADESCCYRYPDVTWTYESGEQQGLAVDQFKRTTMLAVHQDELLRFRQNFLSACSTVECGDHITIRHASGVEGILAKWRQDDIDEL